MRVSVRCEVQYDYGLRQSRARDLDRRPSTVVTREGKTIVVAKEVAASNDRITQRGRVRGFVLPRAGRSEHRTENPQETRKEGQTGRSRDQGVHQHGALGIAVCPDFYIRPVRFSV